MVSFDPAAVRRYYDRNTTTFVTFGQGAGAIHRAVWGPGVRTRDAAFHYAEDRIAALAADRAGSRPEPKILDLGCGVGASLCYLARRISMHGIGITLSPVQARLASERIGAEGLADRVRCIEGDYCDLPTDLAGADLAYAIESFVHGPDPRRFFAEAARVLRPGGHLIICDDFRRPSATGAKAERALSQFCSGWHVNTLIGTDLAQSLAHAAGFAHEESTDLTPYLELGRPRDRLIAVAAALARQWPGTATRFGHLIGGSALQRCLRNGWIGHELMVFRRTETTTAGTPDAFTSCRS